MTLNSNSGLPNFPPNEEANHENEETESEKIRTDADIVKELVEMKFLKRKEKNQAT